MVSPIRREDGIIFKFGGGINSRASEDEILPIEAADGQNFILDLANRRLKKRPPFDLVSTVPNGGRINGFAQLRDTNDTITTLVQAGDTVYSWTGPTSNGFTSVGTVSSSARLRGPLTANWLLDDVVIITDLADAQPALQWDGTTLSTLAHNLGGDFYARYAIVSNERMLYGNVTSGTATPHLLVGSTLQDYKTLSVSDRPSSALGTGDPWFLTTLDLRPINGLVEAFGVIAISSERGRMYKLTGNDSTDFAVEELYLGSNADGKESTSFVGNDIYFGRVGGVESLAGVSAFGDVEADDISVKISDVLESYKDWTLAYNSRTRRLICFANGQSSAYVLHKPLVNTDISPWMKFKTAHSLAMQPTTAMVFYDPDDSLLYTWMGDASGNIYRLEGSGASGDGGSADVRMEYISPQFSAPFDADAYNLEGWINYRKDEAATISLSVLWSGKQVFNTQEKIVTASAAGGSYWGDDSYWGGNFYWGKQFGGRITSQKWYPEGSSNRFQVKIVVEGSTNVEITEVGLRFKEAST